MLHTIRQNVYSYGAFTVPSPSKRINNKATTVAFFTHNLKSQGAQRSLLELATRINRCDEYRSVLYTPGHGELENHYQEHGVQVFVYSRLNAVNPENSDYISRKQRLIEMLQSAKVDIVHANTLQTYDVVVAASEIGIPVIWNIRESDDPKKIRESLSKNQKSIFDKAFSSAYRVIFVSSSSQKNWLNAYPMLNSLVIHNSLDWDYMATLSERHCRYSFRAALGIPQTDKIILTTGTVSQRKGQADIIEAIESDHSILEQAILIIAGTNGTDYSKNLKERVRSLNNKLSNRIYLFSERPFEEIVPFYVCADIFIFCSRLESFPRTILEAFFFGLPVITTPVNGIPEMVSSDVNGLFYRPGDFEELGSKIKRLTISNNLFTRLRKNAFEQSRYHRRYDQLVDEYIRSYKNALA